MVMVIVKEMAKGYMADGGDGFIYNTQWAINMFHATSPIDVFDTSSNSGKPSVSVSAPKPLLFLLTYQLMRSMTITNPHMFLQ